MSIFNFCFGHFSFGGGMCFFRSLARSPNEKARTRLDMDKLSPGPRALKSSKAGCPVLSRQFLSHSRSVMQFSQIEPDTFPIFPVSKTRKLLIAAKYGEDSREDKKDEKNSDRFQPLYVCNPLGHRRLIPLRRRNVMIFRLFPDTSSSQAVCSYIEGFECPAVDETAEQELKKDWNQ